MEPITDLYNHFNTPENNLGTIDEFKEFLAVPENAKSFYDHFSKNPENNLGTFQDFSDVFLQKKSPDSSVSSAGLSSQEPAPAAAPKSKTVGGDGFPEVDLNWDTGEIKAKEYPEIPVLPEIGEENKFNTVLSVDAFGNVEMKAPSEKDVEILNKRRALENVRESREGDYESNAVERMERGMSDYEKESQEQRTPIEKLLFNTGITSKQYNAQVSALSRDQGNLVDGLDAIDGEIKAEFGEVAFEQYDQEVADYQLLYEEYASAQKSNKPFPQEKVDEMNALRESTEKFKNSPLVQERNAMVGAMQKNVAKFEEMEKSEDYKGIRAMIAGQKGIQAVADAQVLPYQNVVGIGVKNVAKMVAGIGGLADSIEKAFGGDKTTRGPADVVQDFIIDLGTDAEMLFPTPGKFSRQFKTTTAKWNGYEVDISDDNLTFIKDGKPVNLDISESQEKEIRSLPTEGKLNFVGVPYQMGQVLGDMAVMIYGAGKVSRAFSFLGKNAAAISGVAASTAAQMSNDLYQQGVEMFGEDAEGRQKAAQYTVFAGLGVGAISTLTGFETRLINGTKGLSAAIPKMNVAAAVGKMTPKQAAAVMVPKLIQEGFKEGVIEEVLLENGLKAVTASMLGGRYDMPSLDEAISEGTMGFVAGILGGGATVNQEMNDLQKSSLLAAARDPVKFEQKLREEIAAGRIDGDEEFISKQVSRATRIGAEIDKLAPDIQEDRLLDAVALLDRQGEIQGRLDEVKGNEILEAKYQQELDAINEELSTTFKEVPSENPEAAAEKTVEPTVEVTPEPEPVAEPTITEKISEKVDKSPIKKKLDKIVNKTIEDEIAIEFANGRRLKTADYDNSGDRNNRQGSGIALRYMSKDGESIDVWAQELAEKWGIDEKEAEQRIIDVINNNPDGLLEYADRRLAEDAEIEEAFKVEKEADEIVDSIPEEQAQILETFLEQFEKDGELDEDALEAAFNEAEAGFSPEFLELQEAAPQAYQELKNIINERAKKVSETQEVRSPFGEETQTGKGSIAKETYGQSRGEAVGSAKTTAKVDESSSFPGKTEGSDSITEFTTHTGEVVSGKRLIDALNKVANDRIENAKAVREEDEYASHVTEAEKDENLERDIKYAEDIRRGIVRDMTAAQRINTALTGETVGILPPPKDQKISEKAQKENSYTKNPEQQKIIDSTGRADVLAKQEASTTSDATSEVSKIAPLDKKTVGLAYGNPEKYMGPKKSRKEAEFEGGKLVSTVYEDYTMQEVIANDGSKIQRIVDSNGNPIGDPGLRINIGSKDLKMFTGGKGMSVSEAAITKIFKDKFASPESVKIAEQAKAETRYDKNPEQKKIIDSTGRADVLAAQEAQQEKIDPDEAQKEVLDWMNGVKYSGFFTDQDVKKFAKIAYKYIRMGVRTLADFAKMVGQKVADLSQAGWDRAMGRHNAVSNDLNVRDSINFVNGFVEFFVDSDRYLEEAVKKVKKDGNFTGSEMDPYLQRELLASKIDAKTKALYEDILGAEAGKVGSKKKNANSLRARAEAAGISWDRFNDLMYAQHAAERNKRVKELMEKRKQLKIDAIDQKIMEESMQAAPDLGKINDWQAQRTDLLNEPPFENGSGMSDADAEAIIDQAKADGVWDSFQEFAQEFRDKVLTARVNTLLEGGLIDQAQADVLLSGKREGFDSDFENYVPLYVKEEFLEDDIPTAGADIISAKVYGLRGSQKTKEQRHRPADMAIVLMAQSIKSAEQNKSLEAFAKLVEANPLDRQWKVVPSKARAKVSPIGELETIDDYTPESIKKNAIQFKQDGKTKYIFVMPVEHDGKYVTSPIINLFKHKPKEVNKATDMILGVARFYNKWMRTILTSIDPSFGLPNTFRDLTEAMANSTIYKDEKDIRKAVRRAIIRNYIPAAKAIFTSPWSEGGSRMADYWMQMKKAGVPMTWRTSDDIGSDVENLQEYIKNTKPSAKGFMKGIYERMAFINDTLENTTRLAVYAAMMDAGVDQDYAAGAAKNITVNFEKKGKAGSVINAMYLFASPGIQGARMTTRLATSKSGLAVLSSITALSASIRAMLYYQMEDDDLEEYIYNDFKSTNYLYIPNPLDAKNPITIPKTYSLVRTAMTFGEGLTDMMMGKKTMAAVAGDFMVNSLTVMDPFGGANRSFGAVVPSMFATMADIGINQSWAGSKVYHFDFDPAKPDKFELNTGTFGEKLPLPFTDIEYTDMAESLYGVADVSPTTLEYISKAYLTGIIKTTYNLEQTVEALSKNEPVDSRKVPIMSRFYQDISDTKKNMLYNMYSLTEKNNITEDQKKYLKRKLPEVKKLMSPQAYGKLVSTINKKFFMDKDKWMEQERKKFEKRA